MNENVIPLKPIITIDYDRKDLAQWLRAMADQIETDTQTPIAIVLLVRSIDGSEQAAKRKLRELRKARRRNRHDKIEDHAYHCLFCRAWHLTSQKFETHLDGTPA